MITKKLKSKKCDIRLILDNIRSVHNVGSIFRTAETISISKIYCLGTTPAPLDRFNRVRNDLAKVALGAEKMISWEYVDDQNVERSKLLKKLKKDGFKIVALEQAKKSIDYKKLLISSKMAIIIGNEVSGVSQNLLSMADKIAEIPLAGKKESLNVSVATGIFLYRLFDR